ncbi:hypothetical protein LTR15_002760 [Elasticomyces elasticus]|nr:hypothetical protein LTR15_002760 [Elasticomyces elasticus]
MAGNGPHGLARGPSRRVRLMPSYWRRKDMRYPSLPLARCCTVLNLTSLQIACHGNRWVMHGTNLPEAKAHIHKSFDRLQQATGLADVPTGWYAGGMPNHTKRARAEVHRERGVPLFYCSDTYSSDTPYWVQDPYAAVHGGPDEGMLMIPYSLVTNDHRFFVAQGSGVSKPDDWLDMLKAEFDQLCEEGAAGAPKMMQAWSDYGTQEVYGIFGD